MEKKILVIIIVGLLLIGSFVSGRLYAVVKMDVEGYASIPVDEESIDINGEICTCVLEVGRPQGCNSFCANPSTWDMIPCGVGENYQSCVDLPYYYFYDDCSIQHVAVLQCYYCYDCEPYEELEPYVPPCEPDWFCGEWGFCVNEQQTRDCFDGCGNTKVETKNCTVTISGCTSGETRNFVCFNSGTMGKSWEECKNEVWVYRSINCYYPGETDCKLYCNPLSKVTDNFATGCVQSGWVKDLTLCEVIPEPTEDFGYCGDGNCVSFIGENSETCLQDCPIYTEPPTDWGYKLINVTFIVSLFLMILIVIYFLIKYFVG